MISGGFKELLLFALAVLLVGCATPKSQAYREMYAHLEQQLGSAKPMSWSDFFLVILVDAKHLDYTDCHSFITTVAKHPRDWSKEGDVGHAWVYLQGVIDGEPVFIEGGVSGERGLFQAQYLDGIMNYIDYGYANPTPEQLCNPRYEPNPVRYLWTTQHDGFFQWGPGRHRPSYAAKVELTEEQFLQTLQFIETYDYSHYALVGSQCASFITQIGALNSLDLDTTVYLPLDSCIEIGGESMRLWTDPCFSLLPLSSPDMLERKLMELVAERQAEPALQWYLKTHPEPLQKRLSRAGQSVYRFPNRYARFLRMKQASTDRSEKREL